MDSNTPPEESLPEQESGAVDFLGLARDAYSTSETYTDAYLRDQWERNLKQWQSKHSTNSKYNSESYKGKSQLFRPRTRAAIRKNEAAAAAAFFSTQDVVEVRPEDEFNQQDVISAEVLKEIVEYRLQDSIPWFQILNGAYQSSQIYGQVCSYQYWNYDGTKDEPVIELVPIENIRIDPAADWIDPINSSPYVIQLIPMYVGDIKKKAQTIDPKTGEPEWFSVDEKSLLSASNEYYDSTRIVREDREDSKANYHANNLEFSTAWVRRYVMRYEGVDWLFYTLGDERLLSEPKPLEEAYFHGERPYVMGACIIEAHKPYPSGLPDLTRDVQAEINDVTNQRMDNVKFAINKRYFGRRNSQVDLRSLTRNIPGSVTLMNDPEKDVIVHSTPDVTSSAFQEQDRLNLDFDDLAGTFSGSSVQANRKLNETVGGMNLMSQGANAVAEYQLRTFVETWAEKVLKQLVKLEQNYETDQSLIMRAAQKSKALQQYGQNLPLVVSQMGDQLLAGKVRVSVNVGTGAVDPFAQAEKFAYGLNSLAGLFGEQFAQKLDIEEVASELFGKLGYKNSERFFMEEDSEDPRIFQLQQMVQQLEMQLQQKYDPAEQQAKVRKLDAETEKVKAETVNKNMDSQFSGMKLGEIVATIPQVAPIADSSLESAGFEDKNNTGTPQPEPMDIEVGPQNTSPMHPANPNVGIHEGYEA